MLLCIDTRIVRALVSGSAPLHGSRPTVALRSSPALRVACGDL
jgi:hypothetical protein